MEVGEDMYFFLLLYDDNGFIVWFFDHYPFPADKSGLHHHPDSYTFGKDGINVMDFGPNLMIR